MQTAYRCKGCRAIYTAKISSCDCGKSRNFEYTLVQIIDVPENEDQVPAFKDLKHSRDPRIVNYNKGQTGNGIYAYLGMRSLSLLPDEIVPDVKMMGYMSSTLERGEVPAKIQEDNMRANCVLAAAGPVMLEALYMCYQYFHRKRLVQGATPQTVSRINIIAEAIRLGTDISVFEEPQDVPSSN